VSLLGAFLTLSLSVVPIGALLGAAGRFSWVGRRGPGALPLGLARRVRVERTT